MWKWLLQLANTIISVTFTFIFLHYFYVEHAKTVKECHIDQTGHNECTTYQIAATLWQGTLEDPVAFITLILAILTAVLALATVILIMVTYRGMRDQSIDMGKSLEVAGKSADAAEKSAAVAERSLNDLEAPFIYPVITSGQLMESFYCVRMYNQSAGFPVSATPSVKFTLKNYGRTSAILKGVSCAMVHWDNMPSEINSDCFIKYNLEPILEPGKETSYNFETSIVVGIGRDGWSNIQQKHSFIFLYGDIIFFDIFRQEWSQTFCFFWDSESDRFVPHSARYNERKRTSDFGDKNGASLPTYSFRPSPTRS